ncbi:MAG: lyase family protein [Patescibacteria group bacterium]
MQKEYFGKETKAALKNFPFSAVPFPRELIYAITEIKEAAALANAGAGDLHVDRARAIARACREIRAGKMDDQFPTPILQGGAGTSLHMNLNEVIAAYASQLLKRTKKDFTVHPNDHVNRGQSTNDVCPSALKIASLRLLKGLIGTLGKTVKTFEKKARAFRNIQKLGRTHLQDAIPTTLGEEFAAYAAIMKRDLRRLSEVIPYFTELNLGGTAIGNSLNATPRFVRAMYRHLVHLTKLRVKPSYNLMAQTSSQADFCMLSHALTLLTMDLSKIANDLRLLSSGPRGGFGEIKFKPLQAGSTIMPGKVNPVLLEALNQLYFFVAGNDLVVRNAAHAAQLELGVMFPAMAGSLLSSLKLASEVIAKADKDCLRTLRTDRTRCRELLERSTAYATCLVPRLGYDAVAHIVSESVRTGVPIRALVIRKKLLTEREFDLLTDRSRRSRK